MPDITSLKRPSLPSLCLLEVSPLPPEGIIIPPGVLSDAFADASSVLDAFAFAPLLPRERLAPLTLFTIFTIFAFFAPLLPRERRGGM